MITFKSLQIEPRCLQILESQGITEPTPIQAKAIPDALEGRDLVAIAQTGTGKTLAFGLPALSRIAGLPHGHTRMLVLTPTRELAQQVHDVLQPLARALRLTTVAVYGGTGMERQAQALRRGASIIVATPGRLIDHIDRRNVRFDKLSVFVLDEADRMLDMGFLPPIRRIMTMLPEERQTMMFSATFPEEISRLTAAMQRNPVRIQAGIIARPVDTVNQGVFTVAREGKVNLLADILRGPEVGRTLVFMRTKRSTDRLAKALSKLGFNSEAIHGDLSQGRRTRVIEGFRKGRHQILVATDVAARGLDVQGISHVVNYDIPATGEDYVHRIGRTARANASGHAFTFVSPGEGAQLAIIERTLGRALDRAAWDGAIDIGHSRTSSAPNRNSNSRRTGSWQNQSRKRTTRTSARW